MNSQMNIKFCDNTNCNMTHINRNEIARNYLDLREEKTTKDICWFYHLKQKTLSVSNKQELHEQMKVW